MSFFDDASLVFLPSGQAGKDGKAYSMKPTNGDGDFTFSRGSNLTATRIDSNGLIEKGRENLFKQSNNFNTTPWASSVTLTSGQSGYDGSNDAWLLTKTSSGAQSVYNYINETGLMTMSVHAKAGSTNWMRLTQGGKTAYFDLSGSGAVGTSSNGIDQTITSVGNGWFRCTLTANKTTAGQTPIYPYTAEGDASGSTDSIYIQDSQFEQGLVATEPILSGASTGLAGILEDSPRFDYSGGASCPSLLLEGSRTNEIGYSEYFEGWTPQGSPTITSNYGTSPEGLENSSRLVFTSVSDYIETSVTNTSGVFTLYAKGTGNLILTDSGANASSTTALTSSYQRIELYFSTNTTTLQIKTDSSGLDAEVYAAQFENDTYPTSYIPNHSGGSVTREADSCLINPMSTEYSTNYTFFGEFERIVSEDEESILMQLYDGNAAGTNQYRILNRSNAQLRTRIYFSSSNTSIISATDSFQLGQTIKWAVQYDSRAIKVFIDGAEIGDTSQMVGGIDVISLQNMKVKQILLFDSTLSDFECITLTS